MMPVKWKVYGIAILLTEAVGALSGWLVRDGTALYATTINKPPLSPPGIVFPVVWAVLYALLGIGVARIWMASSSGQRTLALRVFAAQLFFNFFWSPIFFGLRAYGLAFLWLLVLWGLLLWMMLVFRMVDRLAAKLQIPYLIWVTFAGYLNLGVWLLNG